MRIGILTQAIEEKGIGSSVAFRCLVQHLLNQNPGHEVLLLHYAPHPSEPLYRQAPDVILPQQPLAASRAIRRLNLDVVHYHLGGVKMPIWFVNAKRVATVHGDAVAFFNYVQLNWKGRIFDQYLKPLYWRTMNRIFVVSSHSKGLLVDEHSVPPAKIQVVYDAVGQEFHPLPYAECADVLDRYGIDEPFFFHLSRYGWRKNPQPLLRAFAKLQPGSPHTLVIGGKGWENPQTKQLIASLGIKDRVRLLGYLPKTDIIKLYNLALAFVFPSRYEGFGMPNLEAMACGCPVISSNVSAIPEVVGDAGLLVDDPEGAEELASLMRKLARDSNLREELRRRGLKRSREFSWEASARQVWETYIQIGEKM